MIEKINHHLRKNVKVLREKNPDFSSVIVDSQPVKTVERGAHRL
ncbi:hypothetical protein NEOC95_000664 [Neochlamydia sp. AcF95]|nr:hypothetical protein [Neochlamydia sp. AcF95]